MPEPGTKVGRYLIVAQIGDGAIGTVFSVRDERSGKLVALKVIDKRTRRYRVLGAESFVREVHAVAALDHPSVVKLYDVGETGEYAYIAMELLKGGDIWRIFSSDGPFPFDRVARIGAEVAEALAYTHSKGIIHRDLKPANLVLSQSGRCKITDFGFARGVDPDDDFNLAPQKIGTKFYLAPEVVRGQRAGPEADVYGLAITLWVVLLGKSPFAAAKTVEEIGKAKQESPLPDLRVLRPDLPTLFIEAMERALEREPDRRLPMQDFAQRLRAFAPEAANTTDSQPGFSPLTGEHLAKIELSMSNRRGGKRRKDGLAGAGSGSAGAASVGAGAKSGSAGAKSGSPGARSATPGGKSSGAAPARPGGRSSMPGAASGNRSIDRPARPSAARQRAAVRRRNAHIVGVVFGTFCVVGAALAAMLLHRLFGG